MGIKDLPRQLKEDKRFVTEVDPQQLKNKTLGVDAFVWLHRVVSTLSNDDDYLRRFHAIPQVPFYEHLYKKFIAGVRFWQKLDVNLIFVLDGKANPIKESEDQRRQGSRERQVEAFNEFITTGHTSSHKKLRGLAKDACHVTREIVGYFLTWAKENSVEVCGAPMEAEHQLVFMQRNKEIDWIHTIDSDVLPLGATNVIYEVNWNHDKFTLWAYTHEKVVQFFETEVMKRERSFVLHDFVAYCVFLGCGYCERIEGIGPVALNKHFKAVWADKKDEDKQQYLVDLQAYGKFTFLAATEGNDSIVSGAMPVSNYRFQFSEAFAGLTSPIVASSEALEHGHSVHRMPFDRPKWHEDSLDENNVPIWPGYEDDDIITAFGDGMIMSQDLYTFQRWARYPNEDFAEWLPKYPTIDGVLFEYPLVWSLPEGISAKWYWKESIKEYLQLHGYNVTVNADNDDLDAMVKHVRNRCMKRTLTITRIGARIELRGFH